MGFDPLPNPPLPVICPLHIRSSNPVQYVSCFLVLRRFRYKEPGAGGLTPSPLPQSAFLSEHRSAGKGGYRA